MDSEPKLNPRESLVWFTTEVDSFLRGSRPARLHTPLKGIRGVRIGVEEREEERDAHTPRIGFRGSRSHNPERL